MSWSLKNVLGGGNPLKDSQHDHNMISNDQRNKQATGRGTVGIQSSHNVPFPSPSYDHSRSRTTNGSHFQESSTSQALIRVPIEDQLHYEKRRTEILQADVESLERLLKEEKTSLRKNEIKYKEELEKANTSAKTYWERITGVESKSKQISQQRDEVKKQRDFLRDELDRERTFTGRLQSDLEENKKLLGKAQSGLVAKLTDIVSTELSDDEIRNELKEIFEESRSWAQENYRRDIGDAHELKSQLIQEGCLGSDEDFEPHDRFDFGMEIFADLFLETMLNHELCNSFLRNPFFSICPALWVEGEAIDTETPRLLEKLTDHIQGMGNEEKAITWRCDTIKLLRENYQSEQDKVDAVSRVFAQAFVQQRSSLIRQPIDSEEKRSLITIISSFMNLAAKLWSLKTDIQFHGLEHFGSKDITFQSYSKEMSSANVCGLVPGSTRLDGRPIPLVLQPKIDASPRIGVKKSSTQRIIWAEAVVWISDKPKPPAKRKAPTKLQSRQKPSLLEVASPDQAKARLSSKRKVDATVEDVEQDVAATQSTDPDKMETDMV